MAQIKNKQEKIRFVVVGGLNTVIDFIIFLFLGSTGFSPIIANYISTSSAMIFSFTANRRYTFRQLQRPTLSQIVLFIAVTLVGLWIIQPVVIRFCYFMLEADKNSPLILLVVSKTIATVFTLIWNYQWYSRILFSQKTRN